MNEMESTDHVSGHFEDEHERSAYIQELRNRFRPPSSPTGRVALYIQTMLCKVEFLLGGYILDTWETVLVYPAYLLIVVLFIYGIYRQLHNGWILLSNTLGL